MVGSGDLTIESAGEMGRQAFSNVRKPSAVQHEIYKQMEANENRKFDRVGANNPNLGAASIPAQIEQLDERRQSGLRAEKRRVGKECVSPCRSWWWRDT